VGNYINGYGDSIQNSMAASGAVDSAQKKTAVKSGDSAQMALPSSGAAAKKALPSSTTGAQKALPAPSPKTSAGPKPAAQVSKPASIASSTTSKAPSTYTPAYAPAKKPPLPEGKVRINPESRPKPPIGAAKPTGTGARPKPQSNAAVGAKPTAKPTPDGKVRISPESRPKPPSMRK
jgi:hypothetical protein